MPSAVGAVGVGVGVGLGGVVEGGERERDASFLLSAQTNQNREYGATQTRDQGQEGSNEVFARKKLEVGFGTWSKTRRVA